MAETRAVGLNNAENSSVNEELVSPLRQAEHPTPSDSTSKSLTVSETLDASQLTSSVTLEQKTDVLKGQTPFLSPRAQPTQQVTPPLAKALTQSPLRVPSIPSGEPVHRSLGYSMISAMGPPVENKSIDDFIIQERLPKQTYHIVRRAIEKHLDELRVVYLKENPPDSYLSEFETVCAAYYQFLAPDHIPSFTRAVYEEKNGVVAYRGLVSAEIPNFQSVAADALKEEDLNVAHLARPDLMPALDDFDDQIKFWEKKAEELERRKKKLTEDEALLQAKIKRQRDEGLPVNLNDIDALTQKFDANSDAVNDVNKKLHALYTDLFKQHNVSKIEFERYRIVKGLAIGFTSSYILVEDDLHQNNMSKDGKRIDCDMSLAPLSFEIKKGGVIDWAFRFPGKNAMEVTRHDIIHFPNIRDFKPFYWPTNPPPIIPEYAMAVLKTIVPVSTLSTNAYPSQANSIYQKLETNPVFIYHKFATLLKYILTKDDMYRYIALLHMRRESKFQSKSIIEALTQFHAQRIQSFKDKLLCMPEFFEFMSLHGEAIFQRILAEFTRQNERYEQEVAAVEAEIVKLRRQSDGLTETNKSLWSKSTESLAEAKQPFKLNLVEDYNTNLSESKEKELQKKSEVQRLQLKVFDQNAQELKRLAGEISRKESKRDIYRRQRVDTNYVKSMYQNITARLKSTTPTLVIDKEQARSRANSLSGNGSPVVTQPLATSSAASPMPTQQPPSRFPSFLFNFNFGRSPATIVTPTAKPTPNDYNAVREKVVQAMDQYINRLLAWKKTQVPLAEAIQKFCNELKPGPADAAANLQAITSVKAKLEESKAKLTSGEFLATLTTLLSDEIWKINGLEAENTVTNTSTNTVTSALQ